MLNSGGAAILGEIPVAYVANVMVKPASLFAGRIFLFIEFESTALFYVIALLRLAVIIRLFLGLAIRMIALAERLLASFTELTMYTLVRANKFGTARAHSIMLIASVADISVAIIAIVLFS